jgi:hypothetical protein
MGLQIDVVKCEYMRDNHEMEKMREKRRKEWVRKRVNKSSRQLTFFF